MKAVFFDRDGVVNHRIMCGYVCEPDDLELHTDFLQFFPSVFQKGFVPILITNQQGVGKGIMTHWDLHQVHQKMQQEVQRLTGYTFLDIFAATERKSELSRRKPTPSMLIEAANFHSISLTESIMIGDTESDIQAGITAGVRATVFVDRGEKLTDLATVTVKKLDSSLWNLLKI